MATTSITPILPENQQAARTWSSGGERYERITRQITDAITHCVDRLDPKPGEKILDVATGTGAAARLSRGRGATVIGTDFAPDVLQAARELNPAGDIDFRVADAESLPFADGEFDGVTSTFGVMFCDNPERAAAELARVTRPGGRIVLANWIQEGGVYDMFKVIQKHAPRPTTRRPSPFEWGNTARLEELLGDAFDLAIESATSYYREPNSASAWDAFANGYGPIVTLLENFDESQAVALRSDFESFHDQHQTAAGILVPRPYVIVVGRRRS